MKKTFLIFIFILPFLSYSQNKETVDWITNNSIEIEDANPDSELQIFENNTPNKFANAKIYGFGGFSQHKGIFQLKSQILQTLS